MGISAHETIETEVRVGGGKVRIVLVVFCFVALVGFRLANQSGAGSDSSPDPEGAQEATSTTSAASAGSLDQSQPAPIGITTETNEGEPFFSHMTGLDLLVGGQGPLMRIGLDTGSFVEFGRGKYPLGGVGNNLLLMSDSTFSNVRYAPLGNPDGDTSFLSGVRTAHGSSTGLIRGPEPDTAWFLSETREHASWELWSFSEKPGVVRTVEARRDSSGAVSLHPEVVGASSGGVFGQFGGDFTRVADGRLLRVTRRHAIVQQCINPFDCEIVWLDRETWTPNPDIPTDLFSNLYVLSAMITSPDDRYAFATDFKRDGFGSLWNLETGQVVAARFSEVGNGFSDDGRYAAGALSTGGVLIIDLDTGERVEWDPPGNSPAQQLTFVPSSWDGQPGG